MLTYADLCKQAVDPTNIEQNQSKATKKEKVMQNGNKNSEQDQGRRKPGEPSTGLVEGRDGPASKVDTQQEDKNARVGDASGAIQNELYSPPDQVRCKGSFLAMVTDAVFVCGFFLPGFLT